MKYIKIIYRKLYIKHDIFVIFLPHYAIEHIQ